MDEKKNEKSPIDLMKIGRALLDHKKLFWKVWIATFVLSCLWILPQPRYYTTEVSVAPESAESKDMGGLASLASNFGINVGGGSADAIYPQLYPDLFTSTRFLVDLLDIQVTTLDGEISTDYYTYMKSHQKKNILFVPFQYVIDWVKSLFAEEEAAIPSTDGKRFNPFHLSRETDEVVKKVMDNIECTYSRTTDVVTISVTDQDPLVSALLADSIKEHLQNYITEYRTKKARVDYEHYKQQANEAKASYEKARREYATYADMHQNAYMQNVKTRLTDLENEMSMKYNIYSAMTTREQTAMADLQASTPVFTTLTNATVPVKPTGPKRMIFVLAMLFLATLGTIMYLFRKELKDWF